MSKPQVTLFRDFIEDGRTSMEVYADGLTKSLSENVGNRFYITEYVPHTSRPLGRLPDEFRMRAERYLSYPLQAKRNQGSVNHIIDHAYGHLLRWIDPTRSIVSVHDLIPILAYNNKIPGMSYPNLPLLFKFSMASLKKARFITAVSNSTKNDLVTYCGLAENRINVIHNGIWEGFSSFTDTERRRVRKSFGFLGEEAHVILITGSLKYKNHDTSFSIIEILQQRTIKPVQLVILKDAANELEVDVTKYRLNEPPIIVSGLNKERLVDLYNAVDCLLFPSLYEGFGWPPLEAMACGTPVVASNVASLPEIIGDAGIMESPHEPGKLAEAVLQFLEDKKFSNEYVQRGLIRVEQFSWKRCADAFVKLYDNILEPDIN